MCILEIARDRQTIFADGLSAMMRAVDGAISKSLPPLPVERKRQIWKRIRNDTGSRQAYLARLADIHGDKRDIDVLDRQYIESSEREFG